MKWGESKEFLLILRKIKDEELVSIIVDIYVIDSDGKINTKEKNKWECIVNFTVDDLTKRKLKFSDAEVIMRQVADKLVTTSSFSGINFKDYIKKLKKIIY
jgi:malic enzyme